ncbi:MAG: hypothetical protein NT056_05850, partial [Proteobacteria bacterium]|nr:hypothetical protein [Pseudomonadota bacterium]
RETWAFRFTFFQYTPIMHGHIVFNMNNSNAVIIGRPNWFSIACIVWIMAFFFLKNYENSSSWFDLLFLMGFVLIFYLLYLIQSNRFKKISKALEENDSAENIKTG